MEDLDQFPPIKDIPLYASASHGSALRNGFNTVITLQTIFYQQGDDPSHVTFKNILHDIKNEKPSLEDWNLLVSRTCSFLRRVVYFPCFNALICNQQTSHPS